MAIHPSALQASLHQVEQEEIGGDQKSSEPLTCEYTFDFMCLHSTMELFTNQKPPDRVKAGRLQPLT